MLKRHAQLFEALFVITDILVASISWVVSYWVRFQSGFLPVEKGIPPFADYLKMLLFVWLIWAYVYRRFNLYRPMRGTSRLREVWLLIRANAFGVVLLLAATYLFMEKDVPFSRLVFAIFWGISTVLNVVSRSFVRVLLGAFRRRGYNLRYAVIVGSGSLARNIAQSIESNPEFGIELVGCLTSEDSFRYFAEEEGLGNQQSVCLPQAVAPYHSAAHVPVHPSASALATGAYGELGLHGPGSTTSYREQLFHAHVPVPFPSNGGFSSVQALQQIQPRQIPHDFRDHACPGLQVVGTYTDLPRYLESGRIDQVIVALPLDDHHRLEGVISSIGDSIVDVRIVPDVHQFIQLGSEVEDFDGMPVVSLASTPLSGINRVHKRLFDIIVGSVLLLVSLPVLAVVALLVKLTSPGPVLFSQERVGLDGKSFMIYKFRTMRTDAEAQGAKFAVRNDPRVTAIGKFLRRFSIDELPQLFNVLRGHMSLVGPRPERPVFINEFRRHVPRYMLRHKVQAGMTGWAQVHGWRGNTSIERRIEHDLYYIEHWSLILDMKILVYTIFRTVADRNAY